MFNYLYLYYTYINVQPALVSLTDVRNITDRIKGTQHRRTGRSVDKERNVTTTLVLLDQPFQFGRDHSATIIRRHHDTVISAQPAHGGTRLYGVMTLIRSEHDQLSIDRLQALLLVVGEHLVSGGQEGVQVGDGST